MKEPDAGVATESGWDGSYCELEAELIEEILEALDRLLEMDEELDD